MEKSNHYGNLESQIADLYRAADLAATLLEDTLESQRLSSDSDLVRLPTAFTERLLFTAFEVEKRVSALRDFCHDPKNGVFG